MSRIILVFAIVLLQIGTASSQYMDSIKIVPENPTATDSIYLHANIWFFSGTYEIDYEIDTDSSNFITVRDCFYETDAAVVIEYDRIFNLGVMEVGSYDLNYVIQVGITPDLCLPIDSTILPLTFEVSEVSSTTSIDETDVTCFPNPLTGQEFWVSSTDHIKTIVLMDVQGQEILRINDLHTNLHAVDTDGLSTGTYFVQVIDQNEKSTIRKIVKLE